MVDLRVVYRKTNCVCGICDDELRQQWLKAQRDSLLTVKEYATITREHPLSIYRRIREGRQPGVVKVGGWIRLNPPGV